MGQIANGANRQKPRECEAWREIIERAALGLRDSEAGGAEDAALREHLVHCSGCRRYADALQSLTADLQRLSRFPAEPGSDLRARWTAAIRNQAAKGPFAEAVNEWLISLRFALARNFRPIAVLSPIWLLILLFKVATPATPSGLTAAAHSPVAIVHLLRAEQQRFASAALHREPTEQKKPNPSSAQPRSQRSQPTVRQAYSPSGEPFKVPTHLVCA